MSMLGYGRESICLHRDVNVVRIPDGTPDTLPRGHIVTLAQSLGGNYTVLDETGHMVRIAGEDADALGKEPPIHTNLASGTDPETVEKNVWEVLRTIYDPEIPVNIVELGLVYRIELHAQSVEIDLTMTSPTCPMGEMIEDEARQAAAAVLPDGFAVDLRIVWSPPWGPERMSEKARKHFGWDGN